jgi:hypothetical protein
MRSEGFNLVGMEVLYHGRESILLSLMTWTAFSFPFTQMTLYCMVLYCTDGTSETISKWSCASYRVHPSSAFLSPLLSSPLLFSPLLSSVLYAITYSYYGTMVLCVPAPLVSDGMILLYYSSG